MQDAASKFDITDSPVKQQVNDVLEGTDVPSQMNEEKPNKETLLKERQMVAEACALAAIAGVQNSSMLSSLYFGQAHEKTRQEADIMPEKTLLLSIIANITHSALTTIEEHPGKIYRQFEIPK